MVLTRVLLVAITVALPVEIGTESPTCSVATWLLTTTRDGLDKTLRLVTACSASRITLGWVADPTRKLKPGNDWLMKALPIDPTTVAAPVVASVVVAGGVVACVPRIEPVLAGSPRLWLVR